jgi:hypothetical protein
MKLTGHYIILQRGFVPALPVDFRSGLSVFERINNIRRPRGNPSKGGGLCRTLHR